MGTEAGSDRGELRAISASEKWKEGGKKKEKKGGKKRDACKPSRGINNSTKIVKIIRGASGYVTSSQINSSSVVSFFLLFFFFFVSPHYRFFSSFYPS